MFVRILSAHRLKTLALLALLCVAALALLLLPQAASTGVSRGLSLCAALLIPSLFPFLILSGFLSSSGLCHTVGKRMQGITMLLFGLPGCCAPGIVLSFIGGYPTGAATVAALYRQGLLTPAQGARMLRICTCAGPAFLISAVGVHMLGSVRYGVILYAAHLLAALLIGIGERMWKGALPQMPSRPTALQPLSAGAALAESVRGGCRSLLYMCGFVVAFCTLLSLLDAVGLPYTLEAVLSAPFPAASYGRPFCGAISGILEVTTGCLEMSSLGAPDPFLLGCLLGFGGLSVHCQIAAAVHPHRFLLNGFLRARLLHALLGGLLTRLLLSLIPAPLHVLNAANGSPVRLFTVSAAVSVSLLMMCALFLLGLPHRSAKKQ